MTCYDKILGLFPAFFDRRGAKTRYDLFMTSDDVITFMSNHKNPINTLTILKRIGTNLNFNASTLLIDFSI